jgi:hypothetical protein
MTEILNRFQVVLLRWRFCGQVIECNNPLYGWVPGVIADVVPSPYQGDTGYRAYWLADDPAHGSDYLLLSDLVEEG